MGWNRFQKDWMTNSRKQWKDIRFSSNKNAPSVFKNGNTSIILAIYKDNGIIIEKDEKGILLTFN